MTRPPDRATNSPPNSTALSRTEDAQWLILGVGNVLLTDEGIGIHAMTAYQRHSEQLNHSDVRCLDGGTLSFTLSDPVMSARGLVILDCAQLHAAPGTVRCFEGAEMDEFIYRGPKQTVHEVSLGDILDIAKLQGQLPAQRALIGIQPKILAWGDAPTEETRAAIDSVCTLIDELLNRWRDE